MLIGHEICGNPDVASRETETMKPAKSILYSAILLTLIFGSATARAELAEAPIEIIGMDSATDVSAAYDVDTDHDGRTDHTLELEQSDSLA